MCDLRQDASNEVRHAFSADRRLPSPHTRQSDAAGLVECGAGDLESNSRLSAGERGACILRTEFWSGLADYLDDGRGRAIDRDNVETYLKLRTPVNGCSLYLVARTRLGEIGVRFALQGIEHIALFSYLHSRRARLDRVTQGRIRWQRSSEVASVLEVRTSAALQDRSSWRKCYVWYAEQLAELEALLMPLLGRRSGGSASRRSWNRQRFVDDLATWNPWSLSAAEMVLDWADRVLPAQKWGSGARTGTLLCGVRHELGTCMPVALKSSGVVVFRFADMARTPPWHERDVRLAYLDHLRRIPHLHLPDRACDLRPFLPLGAVTGDASWPEFMSAMEWFVDTTRGISPRRHVATPACRGHHGPRLRQTSESAHR